jgi:hypothetical protein
MLFAAMALLGGCKKDAPAAKDAAVAKVAPVAAPVAKVARALDAALAAPVAKAAPDAGDDGPNAMPREWWTTGCPKVLLAISRCADDKGFVDALTVGASKQVRKLTIGRIADLKGSEQPDVADPKTDRAHEECTEFPSVAFADPGFLDNDWRDLAAPEVLADCSKLGAAIAADGGLFGGSVDE